jgi:hypothetical protein
MIILYTKIRQTVNKLNLAVIQTLTKSWDYTKKTFFKFNIENQYGTITFLAIVGYNLYSAQAALIIS